MTPLKEINKEVKFFEETHKYFLHGKEFTSVTTVLGFFKEPFDPNGHITRQCAKRDGITVDQVKENWHKIKVEGQERGKRFHSQAEHFIKTGKILNKDYKDVVRQLKKMKIPGELYSEVGLHSPTYSIAGTCDLISLDGDATTSYDFKTNKAFTVKSKYGKYLLHPLEHLPECDLVTYSLQLCIYNLMLKEHGYKARKNSKILYINPETRMIDTYDVLDLYKEATTLLEHFKKIQEF
jgi:hypothetical protein